MNRYFASLACFLFFYGLVFNGGGAKRHVVTRLIPGRLILVMFFLFQFSVLFYDTILGMILVVGRSFSLLFLLEKVKVKPSGVFACDNERMYLYLCFVVLSFRRSVLGWSVLRSVFSFT